MDPVESKDSIDQLFTKLQSSKEGLSQQEADHRLKEFGKNELEEVKVSWVRIFFRQFRSILIYILLTACIISALTNRWPEFFTIIVLILINGSLGFWQEMKAQSSIEALQEMIEDKAHVFRDKNLQEIVSTHLVPGDVIELNQGDKISCDLRLIEEHGLMVDESSLTGESIPIYKNTEVVDTTEVFKQTHTLFSGSSVVKGKALAIVTATGSNTEFAKIAASLKGKGAISPLKKALRFFAWRYSILLLLLFISVGVFGYIQGRDVVDITTIMIAELVSAIPEGLPIVVTLVMVIGSVLLSKKNTFIRTLDAVETLGSTNVIASDKTGTITAGNLTVEAVFAPNEEELKKVASFCIDLKGDRTDPIDKSIESWSGSGDQGKVFWQYPFDTKLRLMAVGVDEGEKWLFCKGSFEALSARCDSLDPTFQQEEEKLLSQGLRTLAFAKAKWSSENPESWKLEMVGLIGFLDPPKPSAKDAIEQAKLAGIKVMMLTGDHVRTAKSISKLVGIGKEAGEALSGEQINQMDDEKLKQALENTVILARILPEHKERTVKVLQQTGKIVAVTGDGVNDVPALKAANLGIAMGSGTGAAKSASKMIITDNDLNVIVHSIKSGRVIADNIRKVIYYLLSSSMIEIIVISLCIFTGLPLPLTPLQILWINLVTDGVQDKTFAFAKEEGDVMSRMPTSPKKQFFNAHQIFSILYFGVVVGLGAYFLFIYLLQTVSTIVAQSIIFSSIVVVQWFNGVQAQKEKEPFFKRVKYSLQINPWIFLGVAAGICLQLIAVYIFPEGFGAVRLTLGQWKWPLYFSCFAFVVVEIRKWIVIAFQKMAR